MSKEEEKKKFFSLLQDNNIYGDNYIVNEKKYRKQKQWDIANTTTIIDWINTSNLYILLMDTYLSNLKRMLRVNTLWSLMISSITSTVSITQFTVSEVEYPSLTLMIKAVIFITSLLTSIITGYIKVEKIQEKIELIDTHRQKWMKFMTCLTNELQVSSKLRNNAEELISNNRAMFNELSFKRIEIPKNVEDQVSQFLTKRMKTLIDQKTERFRKCTISCCLEKTFCLSNNKHFRLFVELTKQQLSIYKMTHKLMKNELLLLGKTYNDIIRDITFKTDSDLFNYKITTKSVTIVENQKQNGIQNYSPISSDDEESIIDDGADIENNNDTNQRVRLHIQDDLPISNNIHIIDVNRTLSNISGIDDTITNSTDDIDI